MRTAYLIDNEQSYSNDSILAFFFDHSGCAGGERLEDSIFIK